jgi:hypothetical protein
VTSYVWLQLSGWPWANANAPRPIRSSRHIVEDSIHPDTPARQYRLHFLMQEHAQVRDRQARGRAQTTAYVQSDLRSKKLNGAISSLSKYCSTLLRRTDLWRFN